MNENADVSSSPAAVDNISDMARRRRRRMRPKAMTFAGQPLARVDEVVRGESESPSSSASGISEGDDDDDDEDDEDDHHDGRSRALETSSPSSRPDGRPVPPRSALR